MFNSGIKVNQRYNRYQQLICCINMFWMFIFFRCNGIKASPSVDQIIVNNKTVLHTNYNNKHKIVSKDLFNDEDGRDRRFIMGPETISNPFLQSSNINSELADTKVKIEPDDLVFDNNLSGYSIIGKYYFIYYMFMS